MSARFGWPNMQQERRPVGRAHQASTANAAPHPFAPHPQHAKSSIQRESALALLSFFNQDTHGDGPICFR
ncbi:MAG: hypothetical protein ICV68_11865 [Pyrinomonadaceae bacterium]|nr:hypothetical protein [Pyrinomonadaceae bacterium]